MRVRHSLGKLTWSLTAAALTVVLLPAAALAQIIEITPSPTEPATSKLAPGTQWVYWMAIGAGILGVVIVLGIAAGYMRFAPKFFGREEAPRRPAPGARPEALVRQAAAIRHTPAPATHAAPGPAQAPAAAGATATAVAERPAPTPTPAAAEATTPGPGAEGAAAAAEASARPTATAGSEPAVQADAVGEAEAAAPEARPSAKTAEEVGESPEEAEPEAASVAPEAASAAPEAASVAPAAAPAATAAPAPATAASHGGSEMDQETFDRVLEEQLGKGVDRRVAEGRARAAAVVAARRKSQA